MELLESRRNAVVASILATGLGAYILLHFAEPDLAITWSYAHLHRRPFLPWVGGALVVLLPALGAALWRHPAAQRPLGHLSRPRIFGTVIALFVGLFTLSLWFPQVPHAIDSAEFLFGASQPGFHFNPRWYLSIRTYRLLSTVLVPPLSPEHFARGMNALLGAVALTAFAGSARLLSKTRGEAIALTLLVWSSFAVLQMSIGYLDIYPVPLAVSAVYVWLALRVLEQRTQLLWPLLIVGVGPFFYIGLILLAPSAIFLVFDVVRRDRGFRHVWRPMLLTAACAVFATVPGHGYPLAWSEWYAEAAQAASCHWGYQDSSCLLPLDYMFSWPHLNEMIHLLLLVDGIGLLLFAVCTSSELLRDPQKIDLRVLILGSIAAGHFALLLVLDPLFGPYSDWDAYTYPAVPLTLLGGWGFLLWGRRQPRLFGFLLGLALAAASIHALARLNAMHVDYRRHLKESPCHVNCGPRGSYYDTCRNCTWDGVLLLCECRTRAGEWRDSGTMQRCIHGYRNNDGYLRCE